MGMIGTSIVSVILTIVSSFLFSKMIPVIQRRKKHAANTTAPMSSVMTPDDSTTQMIEEPIYDDIELTDKTSTVDFSKNVAYVCTKNY